MKEIEQARKAGYSDKEIFEHLSKHPAYSDKIEKATEAGYRPKQIINQIDKGRAFNGGIAGFAAEYPKEAAAGALISNTAGLLEGITGAMKQPAIPGQAPRKMTSEILNDISGVSDLPPEAREEADILNFLVGVAGPAAAQKIFKGLKGLGGAFKGKPPAGPGSPPINSPNQAANIAKSLIGEGEPLSQFEVASQALERQSPKTEIGKPLGVDVEIHAPSGKDLKGIIKEESGPGHAISPVEFESEAAAGQGTSSAIKDAATTERKAVTELYKQAKENYQNINSIADEQLISELKEETNKIRQSLKPNTAEASVVKTVDDILESYVLRNGVSVGELIKSSDSLSGMANYELPFTGPKDILKRVATSLDQAGMRAIDNNGGNSELLKSANKAYGQWANRFANDEVSPFLERTIRAPEQLARKTVSDEGVFRAVEDALQNTKNGKTFSDAFARKIAESKMGKYSAKDSSKVGSAKYEEDLRNLKALIGEKRAVEFDKALRKKAKIKEASRSAFAHKEEAKVSEGNKFESLKKKISQHKKIDPEDITKKLKSRSGIKELRKELTEKEFEQLAREEVRNILQKNKVEAEFTGEALYDVLNDRHNAEILNELLGKEVVDAARAQFKLIGDKEITSKILGQLLARLGKFALGTKGAGILIYALKSLSK